MTYVDREAVVAHLHRSDSAWEEPDLGLLNGQIIPAPMLPLALFGPWDLWLRRFAESVSAPTDYAALALLASAGACIGAARRAHAWAEWKEYPALWGLLVGDPSAAKTPVYAPFIAALRAIEREEAADLPDRRRRWETDKLAAEECAQAWEQSVARAVKNCEPVPLKPHDADTPEEPKPPRIVVSDATVEALAPLFKANPRGLLLARDELAGWIGNFGKYGGDGDAAFFLERYTGQPITTDRVRAGNITADRGLLAVFGSIQPERLSDLLLRRADDGFVARLLVVYPDPIPRRRPAEAVNMEVLYVALRRLRGLEIDHDDNGSPTPRDLRLTADAEEAFAAWWQENEDAIRSASGFTQGFLGKGAGMVLRLSLILELLEWSAASNVREPEAISEKAVLAACALFDAYFVAMAARAYGAADRSREDCTATAVLRHLRANPRPIISATWLRRGSKLPGLRTAAEVEAVLSVLSEGGWVRFVGSRDGGTPGRLKSDYEVNPKLWGGK